MKRIILLLACTSLFAAVEYTPPVTPTFSFTAKAVFCALDDAGIPSSGYVDILKKTTIGGAQVAPSEVQRTEMDGATWLALLNQPLILLVEGNVITCRVANVIGSMFDAMAKRDNPALTGAFADQIPLPVVPVVEEVSTNEVPVEPVVEPVQ